MKLHFILLYAINVIMPYICGVTHFGFVHNFFFSFSEASERLGKSTRSLSRTRATRQFPGEVHHGGGRQQRGGGWQKGGCTEEGVSVDDAEGKGFHRGSFQNILLQSKV